MEEKGIFYGCYQGNYEKKYKWQCKAFDNPHDATRYTLDNNTHSRPSLLLQVSEYMPNAFHKIALENKIKNISKIDIN
jgi:hypothetical protein